MIDTKRLHSYCRRNIITIKAEFKEFKPPLEADQIWNLVQTWLFQLKSLIIIIISFEIWAGAPIIPGMIVQPCYSNSLNSASI